MERLTNYFNGDTMAADVWQTKYQMKNQQGKPVEDTPDDMHLRMAKEFARIEYNYIDTETKKASEVKNLSRYGQELFMKRVHQSETDITDELFSYFRNFGYIVPQGSVMSNLGNNYVFGSLSNCFGIAPPKDSYGGIVRADQELVQLMKRRGGVGFHLSNIRPATALVSNAAKTSSGVCSFAERFSNSTREVAQDGRRGALMELLHVKHPEIFKWVKMKADKTKVTGANISVMFTDEFLQKVENKEDFYCTFPIDADHPPLLELNKELEYNKMIDLSHYGWKIKYCMKIKAHELFNEFVHQAWDNAEPGAAFIDRITNYSPDGVYTQYCPELCNPCGEQWFHAYETCRLIALNFWSFVTNPFKEDARIDYGKLYDMAYMQQRLGDALVDLELESVDRILNKLLTEREDEEDDVEINLWLKVRKIAYEGRRTGNGFTALGDMLAGVNVKYGGEEGNSVVEKVMRVKMRAELDATIDMAILRGTFTGWNPNLEMNDFYTMLSYDFPEQYQRMGNYGRRNVNWSTVAPTGTVSVVTQTTSGIEPMFAAWYMRRTKITGTEPNARVDFTDPSGDQWMEYPVLHPKFKIWIEQTNLFTALKRDTPGTELVSVDQTLTIGARTHQIQKAEDLPKEMLEEFYKNSPYYGAAANDLTAAQRISTQAIVQKYTSNAISATVNLPKDVKEEVVHEIYLSAWKAGLKGVTIYRDGSRTGVLLTEPTKTVAVINKHGYTDAVKRPDILEADYYYIQTMGRKFAVIVGKLDGVPYELFAFANPLREEKLQGAVTKHGAGRYEFRSSLSLYTIENLALPSDHTDETLLTRMVSMLLRHGASPKFIIDQVNKSEIHVVAFAKAISRVLKNYILDEKVAGEKCISCGEEAMIYQEGCKRCANCGNSKC